MVIAIRQPDVEKRFWAVAPRGGSSTIPSCRTAAAAENESFGAPGGIRTPNPQIRSLVLCPIELRARTK